jgi:integrase
MGALTAKLLENINKPGIYEDGDGLRLVIKSEGARSWILRYQFQGIRRDVGLGGYPKTSLGEARKKAAEKRGLISKGIDPLEQKQREQKAKQEAKAKARTFEDCALEYIETQRGGWKNAKHAAQWVSTLNTYAFPVIGKKFVGSVNTDDVLEILKPLWNTKPETASRVRSRIELVLDAAKAKRLRSGENPALWRGHLDKLLPKSSKVKAVKHHPAMPWPELPAFMQDLVKADGLSARALEFTILTACRTSEVLGATWGEVDLNARVWVIPADRMKAEQEHRVPLTDTAIKVLRLLPHDGSYLFPGMKKDRPLSNVSMLKVLERMGKDSYTVHGFRSTFRDWAAENTNAPRELCEQVLAHQIAGKAEAAYFRSDLFEKRRQLMDSWAGYATAQPKTGKVVKGKFGK